MKPRFASVALASLIVLLTMHSGRGDEPSSEDLDQVVGRLLPKGWVAERKTFVNLDRVLPGVHSYFCRRLARGGYPYEMIVIARDGTVLDRSSGGVLMARAEAAKITARRTPEGWKVAEESSVGVTSLLEAFCSRAPRAALDPGGALTSAVVLLDLLTYEGRFVSATVTTTDISGLEVVVDWRQGSGLWSFQERSRWTLRFDRSGKLQKLEKALTSFEKHLRK